MSIQITINGNDAFETLAQLRSLSAGLLPSAGAPTTVAAEKPQPEVQAEPEKPATKTRGKKADKPAPEVQPDTPEAEAQDAADEQAEVEETRDAKAPLTVDDVRAVMSGYVKKFGMGATQEDGPKIFVEALGNPPAGEKYWKLSLLPEDQDKLAKVIETWKKATELNPLKRTAV